MGLCILLFAGCTAPQQAFVTDVNVFGWDTPATVSFRNTDTLIPRNLYIVLRSNEALRGDTLTLRIAAFSPDSTSFEEPFLLRIPHEPKAAPLRCEADIPYRLDAILSDTGIYYFTFTPARTVQGVEAIGIHIANDCYGKR